MANNVALNPGSGGDTVWADDVSGVKVQGVKLVTGGEDVGQYGATPVRILSSGSNADEKQIKATAGTVYGIVAVNTDATECFLHLYNLTAANTTVGTSTPVVTIPLLATGGAVVSVPLGILFSTAITAAITTTVGGSTSVTANKVVANILYA
jgi:hypothetical protein